ncbi:histidine kinase [Aquimarina gracilis]|uniref:Histidine kinase n=1 Tax=Aquimarina gracilis TaxID=874422 RepID=A0ABU5ZQH4_9FLAO|nr:histidine kinase [Aquimarina gracilis]MEB3344179.1 histidine kinase [Aquimarina gracilis]
METRLNKSDYTVIIIVYVITTILNCINYYRQDNELLEYLIDIPAAIITSFAVSLLFIYWIVPNFLIKEKKYFQLAFWGLTILGIGGFITYLAGYWSGGHDWNSFPTWYNLIAISVFEITEEVGFTLGILLSKKFYESQAQFFNVQKQQKENELKLLRSQIDPHFLFNNLNTLDALIDSNATKAKEYINRLSLIYRYLIQTKDAEVMELSEEIELAENYIFLIQTRFGKDYNFEVKKDITLEDKFIPTGALQTLLENVVKHNKAVGQGRINVLVEVTDDWLTVINNKSNMRSGQESFGTGLENLKTRYKLLSDQEIQIINTESKYKVSIPIIKLSSES